MQVKAIATGFYLWKRQSGDVFDIPDEIGKIKSPWFEPVPPPAAPVPAPVPAPVDPGKQAEIARLKAELAVVQGDKT
jgi:hypothetical protein